MNVTPAQIAARARALGLDPRAVLQVGSAEGLSGGVGDGGHAFGPFQLNDAGGVITGKFPGWTPAQIQQWAWSPAGVDYALAGIARVAKGLSGSGAVSAIVNRFERPADPQGEIARALGHPVQVSSLPSQLSSSPAPAPALPQGAGVNPAVLALLASRQAPPAVPAPAAVSPPPSVNVPAAVQAAIALGQQHILDTGNFHAAPIPSALKGMA